MRDSGCKDIWHVTTNLANVPGTPGLFQVAAYSKTIFPRNVLGKSDHGHHAGWTRNGRAAFLACDIVYAHFHYRPYDEVHRFALQKLAAEVEPEVLADPDRLREYKGRGWHLVNYVLGGTKAYYQQFHNLKEAFRFPGLLERFAAIGSKAPFSAFVLPPEAYVPEATPDPGVAPPRKPPFAILDEANTRKVRGWATDPAAPDHPVQVRFLVNGAPVWDGICDGARADVRKGRHPTGRVGFEFDLVHLRAPPGEQLLTAEAADSTPMLLFVDGKACTGLALPGAGDKPDTPLVVVDEATTIRVRGWASNPLDPATPVVLRFLVNGTLVWGGPCVALRTDVRQEGHATGHVGFGFSIPPGMAEAGEMELTAEEGEGQRVRLSVQGRIRMAVSLTQAEGLPPAASIHSHLDSFRNGRVQGWVLRSVATPDGARLLGRCTVVLASQGHVISQVVADMARPDVGKALRGEDACGFVIEVPRQRHPVFRLYVLPEWQELAGSPCVPAPAFESANG
jgi:hypothetical protein